VRRRRTKRDVVGEENPASADSADSDAIPPRDAIPEFPTTDRDESATGVELERPSTPISESPLSEGDDHIFGYSFQPHLFGQLTSFAVGPRTPTRRNASESSTSSLESTPEVLRTPIERLSFAGMGFADPGPESPLFHIRLASLSAVPVLAPKHGFPGQHGVGLDDDNVLPDPLMCHDDLFA
jgi:hypothetical protein